MSVLISGSEKIHVPYLKLFRFLLQNGHRVFPPLYRFFFFFPALASHDLTTHFKKGNFKFTQDIHTIVQVLAEYTWASESSCLPPQGLACLDTHRADGFG